MSIWKPELIVLGPGGVKGFLPLGSLVYLERSGLLNNVHTYVGVSVGAIISLLVIAGYSVYDEIIKDALEIDLFSDFGNISLDILRSQSGIISNTKIRDFLSKKIRDKFKDLAPYLKSTEYVPNMKQFYDLTGIRLVTVTLNVDTKTTEYMSYENEPNLSVIDAVMLSINIPLIFPQIKYKGNTYVDGALGNPYPVDIFDDDRTNILGIYIDVDSKSDTIFSYLYKIFDSIMAQSKNKTVSQSSDKCRHLVLVSNTMDILGVGINNDQKIKMVIEGIRRTKEFFDNSAYIDKEKLA